MSKPRKLLGGGVLFLAWALAPAAGAAAQPVTPQGAGAPREPAVPFVTVEELKAKVNAGQPVTILDVRGAAVYAGGDERIKGALRIKLRRLRSRLGYAPLRDIPREREVVTYCACPADEASIRAAEVLLQAGFKRVRTLKGGWEAWLAAGGPIEERPGT